MIIVERADSVNLRPVKLGNTHHFFAVNIVKRKVIMTTGLLLVFPFYLFTDIKVNGLVWL